MTHRRRSLRMAALVGILTVIAAGFVCSGAGDVGIWLPDDGIRVPITRALRLWSRRAMHLCWRISGSQGC